ncbi:MAG: hypothetical protein M3459_13040 [Actinomycetota bacterium]|nr:hypothetical protein [Actinomycetota bacterium]
MGWFDDVGGWFVREQVPDDRRAVRIRLTGHAQVTLPQIEANWRKLAATATATAGLDRHERDQLVTLLDHVRDNLLALTTAEESEPPEANAAEMHRPA